MEVYWAILHEADSQRGDREEIEEDLDDTAVEYLDFEVHEDGDGGHVEDDHPAPSDLTYDNICAKTTENHRAWWSAYAEYVRSLPPMICRLTIDRPDLGFDRACRYQAARDPSLNPEHITPETPDQLIQFIAHKVNSSRACGWLMSRIVT